MADDGRLSEAVDRVRLSAKDGPMSVEEIVEAVGDRGVLPLILVPALITVTPLSGIPGVSIVCGLTIALLSFEHIAGFRKLHLPGRLKAMSIDGEKLRAALDRVLPVVRWLDTHTRERWAFLFHRPFIWIASALSLLTGTAMPFLEFIPFSSSIAAAAVCLLTIAMLTRDGSFFLLALLPYSGMGYLIARVVTG